jgi:hypothetical protein
MKFEELLYQPVRTPLEGFDKAVATGFEIAQNQERLLQNQEQINLKKQEIKDEFLTKGMNLMSILPKLKSSKQKNFYNGMMRTYFEKAGFDPQKIDSLFNQMDADEDLSVSFADYVSTLNKIYPNTVEGIQQKKIKISEFTDADEEQRKTVIDDYTAQSKQLLAEQTMKAMTQETAKRKVSEEATKAAAPMHVIDRVNQGDFGYANDWRTASDKIINARTSLKDAKFISPEQRSQLETQMNMAQAMIRSPETFQNGIMMADAVSVASGEAISKSTQVEEVGKGKRAAAIQAGTQGRFEARQYEKRLEDTGKYVKDLVDNTFKSYEKSAPAVKNLEDALNDPKADGGRIKQLGSIFARSILDERGAMSDQDINRVFNRTLGSDIKGVARYFFGTTALPKGLINQMKANIAGFKNAAFEFQKTKLVRGLQRAQLDERLKEQFGFGKSGYNQLINEVNNIIRTNNLGMGKKQTRAGVESVVRSKLKKNKGESDQEFETRIQKATERSIFNNLIEYNQPLELM